MEEEQDGRGVRPVGLRFHDRTIREQEHELYTETKYALRQALLARW